MPQLRLGHCLPALRLFPNCQGLSFPTCSQGQEGPLRYQLWDQEGTRGHVSLRGSPVLGPLRDGRQWGSWSLGLG